MNTKLIWATPEADKLIAYIARVSNPANQDNESITGLLKYMMTHNHVSPFEMASACIEITTTRDIGRQILRHRSFSFQEFSQRYANTNDLPDAPLRECRLQDSVNRQNSIEAGEDNQWLSNSWAHLQNKIMLEAQDAYDWALKNGVAKEQARAILPEGLTTSRMYMSGTLRSWLHYLQSRLDPSTQKEHRAIAQQVLDELRKVAPVTINAFFPVMK